MKEANKTSAVDCPQCRASGWFRKSECGLCKGTGIVSSSVAAFYKSRNKSGGKIFGFIMMIIVSAIVYLLLKS